MKKLIYLMLRFFLPEQSEVAEDKKVIFTYRVLTLVS